MQVNWRYCKHGIFCTNDQLWSLKFRRVLCPRTEKYLSLRKAKKAKAVINRERYNNVLFNKLYVFHMLLIAVIKQYLQNSVKYTLKVWVSFKNIKINIYHKSNTFSIAYQQRIRIVFFFNSKLSDFADWNNAQGELANKADNRTI